MAHPAFSSRSGLLSAAAFAVLAGCSHVSDPNTGAVVVTAAVPGRPAAEAPPLGVFDERRVDPAFTRAVADFAREVSRLETTYDADPYFSARRALEVLANAIETAPYAEGDDHVTLALGTLRTEQGRLANAFIASAQPMERFASALAAAADAFESLALGPYHDAPQVYERVQAFKEATAALRYPERLRSSRAEVVAALQRAALVLTAMHTAVARGLVS